MTNYDAYVEDVLNGKIIANEYIKLACKRYLSFRERDDIVFKPKKVEKCIRFISNLKHFQGKCNGKPFILQPWQEFIIANIFGFYWADSKKRVTKKIYMEIGRKNGKSALISAIALYSLIADGEAGSEIDCVASTRQQAHILFDMCTNFIKTVDKKEKFVKQYRDKLKFDATASLLQVLAADSTTLDGYNSSCFIIDELHAQKDSRLYDVLASSQGMRTSPLAICITSAGFNRFSFCYGMRETCIEILYGKKIDDSQFSMIYSLDVGDDWKDENNWLKSNPNLDVTVERDFLRQQVNDAKNNTLLEVSVRTKNFGEWISSQDIWIPSDLLLKYSKKVDLNKFPDETIGYVGVDLASVSDFTAMSVMVYYNEKYYFKTFYYLPQSALTDNVNSQLYQDWHRNGYLIVTDGNVTDYDFIVNDLLKINQKLLIEKIAYDAYNATQWAISCTEQGLPLEPYSQALWNFNKPTKEMERLIKSGQAIIDNNPINRYCFQNVALKFDFNENCKPVKSVAMNKIDGVISMIEALGIFLQTPHYNNDILAV